MCFFDSCKYNLGVHDRQFLALSPSTCSRHVKVFSQAHFYQKEKKVKCSSIQFSEILVPDGTQISAKLLAFSKIQVPLITTNTRYALVLNKSRCQPYKKCVHVNFSIIINNFSTDPNENESAFIMVRKSSVGFSKKWLSFIIKLPVSTNITACLLIGIQE